MGYKWAAMLVRREPFAVHSYEVDAFNVLAAPALAGYLQEVAGLQASEMGCGLDALMLRGMTWVLSRQRIEIARPIALADALDVATWPSGLDRLFALREFRVSRQDGATVAEASTDWLVMDLAKRRPVRPDRVLERRYQAAQDRVAPPAAEMPSLDAADAEQRFKIRYQDIDRNLHVTSTTYLAWALESVPQDVWRSSRLASIETHFLAECTYGSRILSRLGARGERGFLHAIVREEDGKELARLTTRWADRSS
jgi:medium-chain acyl-[acyl-carrier-protein] hydrolase